MDGDDMRPEPDQTEAPMKMEPIEAGHEISSSPEKAKDQKNKFGGHHGFSPKVSARFCLIVAAAVATAVLAVVVSIPL